MRLLIMHVLLVSLLSTVPQTSAPQTSAQESEGKYVVFEGTVVKIGPRMPASGYFLFFRLAKYQVEKVCRGKYDKKEIIVDHLSLYTGEELEGIKVGDRVYLAVEPTKKESLGKTLVEGIRESYDNVDAIYVGGEVVPANGEDCKSKETEALQYLNNRSRRVP